MVGFPLPSTPQVVSRSSSPFPPRIVWVPLNTIVDWFTSHPTVLVLSCNPLSNRPLVAYYFLSGVRHNHFVQPHDWRLLHIRDSGQRDVLRRGG